MSFWQVICRICIYKWSRVKVYILRPGLYATSFGGLEVWSWTPVWTKLSFHWQSIWRVTCTNAYTWPSALDYQKTWKCWPFFL